MTSTVFYQGSSELAVLTNVFTTAAGDLVDPATVTLVVTDPQGTVTTYTWPSPSTITRVSAGTFQVDQPCGSAPGLWGFVWIGTGNGSDVSPGTWRVFTASPAQFYTSPAELKDRLSITDDDDNLAIELAVRSAARYIEGRCGRFFYQIAETRTFVPQGIYALRIDDLASITSMVTDPNGDGTFPQTWTQGTDFELAYGHREYNQFASGEARPYREVHVIGGGSKFFPYTWPLTRADRIKITGTWGWPAVPDAITTASLLLAADLFKLKDAPFGIAGSSDMQMRVQAGSQIELLISPYVDPTRRVGV